MEHNDRFPDKPMMALGDILRTIEYQKLPVGEGKEIGLGMSTPSYFVDIPATSDREEFLVYARLEPNTEGIFNFFRRLFKYGLGDASHPYFGYICTRRCDRGYGSDSFYYFKGLDARLLFKKMESLYVKK